MESPNGQPTLHTAATKGHLEVVNLLLDAGSSLATIAKSNGKTALHSAARNGHVEVKQMNFQAGFNTRAFMCQRTRDNDRGVWTGNISVKLLGQSPWPSQKSFAGKKKKDLSN
ncbi:hypothetical protein NC651_012828 [Populus alba x Populus x berolinensis]|nr:hypothetical protein NC651_012828 [Populus alba x Populus x berolinensis]